MVVTDSLADSRPRLSLSGLSGFTHLSDLLNLWDRQRQQQQHKKIKKKKKITNNKNWQNKINWQNSKLTKQKIVTKHKNYQTQELTIANTDKKLNCKNTTTNFFLNDSTQKLTKHINWPNTKLTKHKKLTKHTNWHNTEKNWQNTIPGKT